MWSQIKKSHVNVVSKKQVSNVVVSNEPGLKCRGFYCLHTLQSNTRIKYQSATATVNSDMKFVHKI